jgi:hypothetical protein
MKLIFKGCSEEQRKWGSHTGDPNELVVDKSYEEDYREVHTWHTKVFLRGIKGSFNSVCFEEAGDE